MIRLAHPSLDAATIRSVVAILESGQLVQGRFVARFERALAEYLSAGHVVVVSSGTAALHLALMAAGIGPGDEVIVPAFTFPATVNVVEVLGAKPVFVDISLQDFNLDPGQIETRITTKTKAVVPVHEFGQPADMDGVLKLASKFNLTVIEDAACALGSTYRGRKAGTLGWAGCFSFHPRKTITTGEGGAIVTNDIALANRLYALRNHGLSPSSDSADLLLAGLNYRLTDFQAAIGLHQLANLDERIMHRRRTASLYDALFEALSWIRPPTRFHERGHSFQTYHILLEPHVDRDAAIQNLRRQSIETNLGAQAVHTLTYYKEKYGYSESDFSNAASAYRHGMALPMGEHIDEEAARSVSTAVLKLTA